MRILHTLTRHNDETDGEWKGYRGRVNAEMIKECAFPEPSAETLILHCGPALFNKCVNEVLLGMGYTAEMIYKF